MVDERTGSHDVTLADVVRALGATVASVTSAPAGADVPVQSETLLEVSDLGAAPDVADLSVVVGATAAELQAWVEGLASRPAALRPRAIAAKVSSTPLAAAAQAAGIAFVTVHPQARLDLVLATVRHLLTTARTGPDDDDPAGGRDDDLYGLAQTVARLTGGLVAVEDPRAQLLAYSATDGAADELRMLSILGREGPSDDLRRLRERGVYDRLRRETGVVEVPADAELGWRRRLAVDIRPLGHHAGGTAASLGTLWLQEGRRALDRDAGTVLEGAAAVAARLVERARDAPSREALQIQRLLGLEGEGVDVPSLAAALSLPTGGPAVVVGLAGHAGESAASGRTSPAELAGAIRLQASAYARESLVTTTRTRVYVLVPRARGSVARWVEGLIDRLERLGASPGGLRAAVSAPVPGLDLVAAARAEVDRVLDRPGGARVTTLAGSRTAVLLGEVADLVAERPRLADPRLQPLDDHERGAELVVSLERFFDHLGDVRAAAATLHVHPNTLRYRLRRVEALTGLRLDDAADRLLLQVQLLRRAGLSAARSRAPASRAGRP